MYAYINAPATTVCTEIPKRVGTPSSVVNVNPRGLARYVFVMLYTPNELMMMNTRAENRVT